MHGKNILVYGARKSGTTLTQRLIDNENMLCHPGETKIKQFFKKDKIKLNFKEHDKNWYFQALNKIKIPKIVSLAKKLINKNKYLSLCEYIDLDLEICRLFYKSIGANKDLKNYIIKEVGGAKPDFIINKFLSCSNNNYVLIVIRDPRYTASAIFRNRRKRQIPLGLLRTLLEALEPFIFTRRVLKLSSKKIFKVFYEKIIEMPNIFVSEIKSAYSMQTKPIAKPTLNGDSIYVHTASNEDKANKVFKRNTDWKIGLTTFEIFCILISMILNITTYLQFKKLFSKNKMLFR